MRRISLALAAVCGLSAVASANVGIGLPLDQYQVGTETTNNTIVTNGNFETTASGVPTDWETRGSFGYGPAVGPNSGSTGSIVSQGPLGAPDATFPQTNGIRQQVNLAAGNYALSAYMWNFGSNFDLAVVELRDSTRDGNGDTTGATVSNANLTLTSNFPSAQDPGLNLDGSRGVFGYSFFNIGAAGAYDLIVKWDKDSSDADPNIGIQVDNVAITPAQQFSPPSVPEPASLGLVALGAVALLRRRR